MKTSCCEDSDFLNQINLILELPGIALAFLGDKEALSIFIEPISVFTLPSAEQLFTSQKKFHLDQFNTWLTKYRTCAPHNCIYGFLCYEAFHYTEELPKAKSDTFNLPAGFFCAYKRIIHVTRDSWQVFYNESTNQNLWNLDISDPQIISLVKYGQALVEANCSKKVPNTNLSCKNVDPNKFCTKKEGFIEGVKSIQSKILAGEVYQANLSLEFQATTNSSNSKLFLNSIYSEKANYGAFFNCGFIHPNHYIISNSPETFIKRTANKILAAPIKGTIPTNNDRFLNQQALDDLLKSSKDNAELAMIVDLFRNDFGKVSNIGSVKVGKFPNSITLNHLHHLFAEITAEVPTSLTDVELIFSCFPSGSISGAPKYTALSTITELENSTRGIYCGGLFSFGNDGFISSVTIRTAIRINDSLYFRAGSGITIDSAPESELNESFTKAIGLLNSVLESK